MKSKAILLFGAMLSLSIASYAGSKPGDRATGFNLPNVNGELVSLDDYLKYDGVILIFTCNTCPVSVAYEERIMQLDEKYRGKGYPVVAINSNSPEVSPGDSFEKMKELSDRREFTFPYLFDADHSIARSYGATKTPHTFLLKRNGDHFVVSYIGAIDDNQKVASVKKNYVEQAIASLSAGNNPDPAETLAVGCSIKFKK